MTYRCIIWSSEIPAPLNGAEERGREGEGEKERERDCGAAQSLVFMTQPQIAALKQAIISLPSPFLPHCCAMNPPPLSSSHPHPLPFLPSVFLHHILPCLFSTLSLYSPVLWEPLRKSFSVVGLYPTGGSYQPTAAALRRFPPRP